MGKHRAPESYQGKHRAENQKMNHPHTLNSGESPAEAAERLAQLDQSQGSGKHAR